MTVTLGLNSACDTGESSTDLVTSANKLIFNLSYSDGLTAGQLIYLEYKYVRPGYDTGDWQQFELGDAYGAHQVDATEVTNKHVNFGTAIDPFDDGVWSFRTRRSESDGTGMIAYSNTMVVTINTVAPILGAMSRLAAPTTTVDLQTSTDQGSGNFYWVITTGPQNSITTTQIMAGHDQSNAVPLQSGIKPITASGTINFSDTGLTPDAILYCYGCQKNALGSVSNIQSVSWLQAQVGWSPAAAAGELRLWLDVQNTASMTTTVIGPNTFVTAMADLGPNHNNMIGNPAGGVGLNACPVLTTLGSQPALWFVNNAAKSMSLNRDSGFTFRSKKATFLWIGRADDSFYGRMISIKTAESTQGDLDYPGLGVGWLENGANPAAMNVGNLYPDPHFITGSMTAGAMNAVLVCFNGTVGELFVAQGGAFVSKGTAAWNTFIGSSTDNGIRVMMGHLDQYQNLQGYLRLVIVTSSDEKANLPFIYNYAKAHTPSIP